MSFPEKNWLGKTKGWQDLGPVNSKRTLVDGKNIETTTRVHRFCRTRVNVGKENTGELFYFCPRCLIEIKD